MEPGNVEVVAKICLVCGLDLSVEEVKAGWAVCEGCQGYTVCLMCGVRLSKVEEAAGLAVCGSCEGYYFPERLVYYVPEGEGRPAVFIRCVRKKPRRLAKVKTPELWISRAGYINL